MKTQILKLGKLLVIALVVLGSIAFFGYEIYRNMGQGSKASSSGVVTVTMSNSISGPVAPGTVFTVGVTLSATSDNKASPISAADLYFTDPQDALDFQKDNIPLEDASSNAFDDPVRVTTTSRNDKSVRLDRITLVAKRSTASLKPVTTIRLRFKARSTASYAYPSAISFGIDAGKSTIIGPGINGNLYGLTPTTIMLPIALGCTGINTCTAGNVCYQSVCRLVCTTTCAGLYHCDHGVCLPGAGGTSSSSSSSTSWAPTATPAPTARPEKANLYFKVKMPDIAEGVAVVPQVRVQVYDSAGLSKVTQTTVALYRESGTDYFRTNGAMELDNISTTLTQYRIFIKQLKTIQHSFTATLQKGTTVDCTTSTGNCGGSLQNPDLAPLLSGDSDGFKDGSDGTPGAQSYNRIDATDLQRMIDEYGVTPLPAEPNADFNLDGKVDILDLGVLGKNYGKVGQ